MRNLLLRSDVSTRLEDESTCETQCFASNPETGDVFYIRRPCTVCCRGSNTWEVDLAEQISDVSGFEISSFSFSLELDSLCITTVAGLLLLLGIETRAVEEVGAIDDGVLAASWSPEGELLALISGSGVLLMFNKDFDVLAEQQLFSRPDRIVPSRELPAEEAGPAVHAASICWRGDGKFFATLSRASADAGGVLRVWDRDACSLHAIGEAVPGLTGPLVWQPNGRHIYAAQHEGPVQKVVLFERNGLSHGSFQCTSEGAVRQMAWSPDSNILAIHTSLQAAGGVAKQGVQLWLRSNWHWYLKQELSFESCADLSLLWSEEGPPVLSICTSAGVLRQVGLGTSTSVSRLGTAVVVDGCRLLITPLRQCVVPPPLAAVTAVCPAPVQCVACSDDDKAEVIAAALSDGRLTLVRSVEEDLWEETLDEACEGQQDDSGALQASTVQNEGAGLSAVAHIRSMAWIGSHTLLCGGSSAQLEGSRESADAIMEVELSEGQSGRLMKGLCHGPLALHDKILSMAASPGGGAFIQLVTGDILKYEAGGLLSEVQGFPKPCPWMCSTPPHSASGASPPAVGLTIGGEVFWGKLLVARNVASIATRQGTPPNPDYLLYTTQDRFLHTRAFADLASGVESSEPLPAQESASRDRGENDAADNHYAAMHAAMRGHGAAVPAAAILKARAVETGATLVAAPPDGVVVILQMPRGNLEAVHPRSLVLPAVAAAVQAGDWGGAWELATTHRVDLNLLVDYGWPRFLAAASEFVRQVPDDQDLVDLLSALRQDSVTAPGALYAGLPPAVLPSDLPAEGGTGDKVEAVCSVLQQAMEAAGREVYLKPLATSFAVLGRVEEALALVKAAKEEQLAQQASGTNANGDVVMGQGALGQHRKLQARVLPSAEDVLIHLLLTLDVEQLYRAALGMYELELAYMVVAHSQRDPGEYLLELQRFAAEPEGPLRRYAVNMHLKRISAALTDLLAAGPQHFQTAVQLARREGKLRELLAMLGEGPEVTQQRREVLREYGSWLAGQSRLEDAAVAFLAAGELASALTQYREGGHWQMALAVAGRLGQSAEEMRGLAEDLVESLTAGGQLAEAARLSAEHLGDAESAVALLCQAREWREAVRNVAVFSRQDLMETTVAPAAAEAASSLLEEFGETQERVRKYEGRLRSVREKRAAMEAALEEGDEADDFEGREGDDGMSDSGSSMVSGLSAYTQASKLVPSTASSTARPPSTAGGRWPQRKKKKRAKKGPKIRQGSPEEEAALVSHILSMEPSARQCAEVGQLAELLALLGHESDARKLQAALSAVMVVQQAAAEYARSVPAALEEDKRSATARTAVVDWKWDIFRPVNNE